MVDNKFHKKQVLIFNRNKVLISICSSVGSAEKVTKSSRASVSAACIGKNITSGGFYFRHVHPNTIIELDDLDRLKVNEYDKLCNTNRLYHSRSKMVAKSEIAKKKRKLNTKQK